MNTNVDMNIENEFRNMQKYFNTDITKNIAFRQDQLLNLKKGILKYEKDITAALYSDLGKAPQESYMTEIGIVLEEISYALKMLPRWQQRRRHNLPLSQFMGISHVYSEPYGTVLIISPWNYPFQLALAPLVGAISAGNCCVIKPSEFAPHTAKVLKDLIAEVYAPQYVTVVEGAIEESQALLKMDFSYIFFTGNPTVGQIVMEAAAKHLTPITLELGGKSPCIVHETANIPLAAKRIAFGKFLNAGQTCVAPDYVLVQESVKDELIASLKHSITDFLGKEPLKNQELPKIITDRHFQRLTKLLINEDIAAGGNFDAKMQKIAPTIVDNAQWDSPLMAEEIFGPILPIITYDYLDNAIFEIKKRDKPLALYLFADDIMAETQILESISFGGGCINDTIIHLASLKLPFGGVGKSGMGSYHGKTSFDTFSHKKSVVKKAKFPDLTLRYHPYSATKLRWIKRFMK
ncbi:MAG: aldehyde dehydrogenase [Clostridiales bacterium]